MTHDISPGTVQTVLNYLCPLSEPLPPHLLSSSLLKRHHFLQITIDDAQNYLCWPAHQSHLALSLLEALPHDFGNNFHLRDDLFSVRYSADPESLFAHIRIIAGALHLSPDLRLVFIWETNSWRYHNLALMPFPPTSHSSLSDALAAFSPEDFQDSYSLTLNNVQDDDNDDDDYWNAYGQTDDPHAAKPHSAQNLSSLNSEDAYWAQYSSIHGSGDSTLPSPRPPKHKQDFVPEQDEASERIIVPYSDFNLPSKEPYNPLEPPSPRSLSRRLAQLDPRPDSPPLLDDSVTSSSDTPSPQLHPSIRSEPSNLSPLLEPLAVNDQAHLAALHSIESQEALKDSIRGIFRLWKAGSPAPRDQEMFLDIVRQVIYQ